MEHPEEEMILMRVFVPHEGGPAPAPWAETPAEIPPSKRRESFIL